MGGHARGDSGFYLRGDDIQLINCAVHDLGNGSTAYNIANLLANGFDYGNRIEFKAVTALNITNGGAMFEIQNTRSDGVVIYDDYIASNVANFKIGSGTYTLRPASEFVEMNQPCGDGGALGLAVQEAQELLILPVQSPGQS